MIRENLNEVQTRLQDLITKGHVVNAYLSKLEKAEELTTLTIEQKGEIFDRVNGMASDIQAAYDSLKEAFQATEVIPEEPE